MTALQDGTTEHYAHFTAAEAQYREQSRESKTIRIFQNLIPNILFYMGFFIMSTLSTAQYTDLRVRHFTILITYMTQLQGPLQSLSASMLKFLDLAVDFERLFNMLT